ncbi:MAG: Hsp20/alpha crystallin family protein [Polaromonas sp.]|uniref:Hsp20/alpha crystallin family protein n=1 Tax=Polaromonas sp. TaxID=1869339 RepID=UPI002730DFF3|nr:Hsp20/alpha crystallin family protein [Polaromonas sp.]MDP1742031.1 Hsp20/alpha crystallin family protein [Polaromonas sp.]MDP3354827.1 Hsp20/alpha crystallin family protein [Polaromonas sp.]
MNTQTSTAASTTRQGGNGSHLDYSSLNDGRNERASSDVARQPRQQAQRYTQATLTPPVDVVEDSSGITLYADLPGVPKDKLKLQVEADTLTIEAEAALNLPEGLQSSHTEVGLARFHRVFTLSKELDTENVSAELTQGVLKLRIPKAAHAQPRRISISAG